MNKQTKSYVGAVSAFAALLVIAVLPGLGIPSQARFGGFLAFCLLSSAFKVRVPGFNGMYSLNFVPMLAAVTEFSWAELLLIALGCAVTQSYWRAAIRPQLIQVAFNLKRAVSR